MCVGCFSLVVSTCQVIGWKDPLVIPLHGEEITSTKPRCMSLCVYVCFFVGFVYVVTCFPRPYTIYISHTYDTPMTLYSLFVVKVPLNTKQTNILGLIRFTIQIEQFLPEFHHCRIGSIVKFSWISCLGGIAVFSFLLYTVF